MSGVRGKGVLGLHFPLLTPYPFTPYGFSSLYVSNASHSCYAM
jgi:hypothetical protein